MFDLASILDGATSALRAHAARLDLEQSPYGLDALDEVALHPTLRAGIESAGLGAIAEQRYPADRARPKRSSGDRCDIVVTPCRGDALQDPLLAGTLFAAHGIESTDALWIEVKCVHQFALIAGVAGPSPDYTAQWSRAVGDDVRWLARDPGVGAGAVLIVCFTADEDVFRHDLLAWAHLALDRGLAIGSPIARTFGITDRIGNAICGVALVEVRPARG